MAIRNAFLRCPYTVITYSRPVYRRIYYTFIGAPQGIAYGGFQMSVVKEGTMRPLEAPRGILYFLLFTVPKA